MLHALLTFAAEAAEHETSKTAFYVAGGLTALWAVCISLLGIARGHGFPSAGASKGIMGVSAVLVVASMATAVITA